MPYGVVQPEKGALYRKEQRLHARAWLPRLTSWRNFYGSGVPGGTGSVSRRTA